MLYKYYGILSRNIFLGGNCSDYIANIPWFYHFLVDDIRVAWQRSSLNNLGMMKKSLNKAALVLIILASLMGGLIGCWKLGRHFWTKYEEYLDEVEARRLELLNSLSWHEAGHLLTAWHLPALSIPSPYGRSDDLEKCLWSQLPHPPGKVYEALEYRLSLVATSVAGIAAERTAGLEQHSIRTDREESRNLAIQFLEQCHKEGLIRSKGIVTAKEGVETKLEMEERALSILKEIQDKIYDFLSGEQDKIYLLADLISKEAGSTLDYNTMLKMLGDRSAAAIPLDVLGSCQQE